MKFSERCKSCRRFDEHLFLKGKRCYSAKCALTRRGERRIGSRELSQFGKQKREIQKLRQIYSINERDLTRVILADKENFLSLLERRLDRVLILAGITYSTNQAREMISLKQLITVHKPNGEFFTCKRPGYIMRVGDRVTFGNNEVVNQVKTISVKWLDLECEDNKVRGIHLRMIPKSLEVPYRIDPSLIIRYYGGRIL